MELKDFIKIFADQFDDTDASEISAETKFRDLDEWSSLIGMGVIAMIKLEFGKSLSGSEMRQCQTVQDLYNLVTNK